MTEQMITDTPRGAVWSDAGLSEGDRVYHLHGPALLTLRSGLVMSPASTDARNGYGLVALITFVSL